MKTKGVVKAVYDKFGILDIEYEIAVDEEIDQVDIEILSVVGVDSIDILNKLSKPEYEDINIMVKKYLATGDIVTASSVQFSDPNSSMAEYLKFESSDDALQHLSDITGKKVMVAIDEGDNDGR